MKVYHGIVNLPTDYEGAWVTIGVFDGLHLAHCQIVRQVVHFARENHSRSMLITFEPHPRQVLNQTPENHLSILTSTAEKIELLDTTGIDDLLFVKTDKNFLETDEKDFISELLVRRLKIRAVVIGYDYHFGRERRGNPNSLKSAGQKYGFKVVVMPPFYFNNVLVRSSLIRQLLTEGQIIQANELLGWLYSFSGNVVRGAGRGRKLGFPTANLRLEVRQKLIPADGVYFVKANLVKNGYYGILNIGVRKTFNESERTIELYLIDFPDQELYGRVLKVAMLERLRDELKFETAGALNKQMQSDLKLCLEKINKIENETEVCIK